MKKIKNHSTKQQSNLLQYFTKVNKNENCVKSDGPCDQMTVPIAGKHDNNEINSLPLEVTLTVDEDIIIETQRKKTVPQTSLKVFLTEKELNTQVTSSPSATPGPDIILETPPKSENKLGTKYKFPSTKQKARKEKENNFDEDLVNEFFSESMFLLNNEHHEKFKNEFKKDLLNKKSHKGVKRKAESDIGNNWKKSTSPENSVGKEDLSECVKCVIESSTRDVKAWELTVCLSTLTLKQQYTCKLKGVWCSLELKQGEIVSVLAKLVDNSWVIDSNFGFISIHPDVMVSSTSLVGSMFCRRKGVLSSYFKGLDGENKAMVIGKLSHDLMQGCVKLNLKSSDEVDAMLDKILHSEDNVKSLYSSSMTTQEAKQELAVYAAQIKEFISTYIENNKVPENKDAFRGKITELLDIEESVTAPKLGVQGRIDMTVKVSSSKYKNVLVPLEIKTGRTTFSNEHISQVILYTMMMNEFGDNVKFGLLLYLKEGLMKEIQATDIVKRDLMLLRNDLVQYLVQSQYKVFGVPNLPDPVSRKSCERCAYLTVCSTFLRKDGFDQISSQHPMKVLVKDKLQHLKEEDIDYFLKWCGLIFIEQEKDIKQIWSMTIDEREANGWANDLKCTKVEKSGDEYIHTFSKMNLKTNLCVDDFVMINIGHKFKVVNGRIVNVTSNAVTIVLEKDLNTRYANQIFSIDKYPSRQLNTNFLSSLGCLLENNDRMNKLREIIVCNKVPSFSNKLQKDVLEKGVDILSNLNELQQRALLKVLAANDYVLIEGMPGSGKTQTIVALIKLLVCLGQTVFIASHTHLAVDNILLRLDVPFLRIGSLSRVNSKLHSKCENTLIKDCKTPEEMSALYNKYNVVAATCFAANHDIFKNRIFDYLIVDESTQVLQPEILQSLFYCKKFVLVGDSNQLPPVVQKKEAVNLGMGESLFAKLQNEASTVSLCIQYRMNSQITSLANKLTYNDKLVCANDDVANRVLKKIKSHSNLKWMSKIISDTLEDSVLFLNTGNTQILSDVKIGQTSNIYEVGIIKTISDIYQKNGIMSIGVISPFRSQVDLLKKHLSAEIEVNTVDQYQGRDKDVILYSCVKVKNNEKTEESEILNDIRRLNVAITRAKYKLIIIGDKSSLKFYKPFAKLFNCLSTEQLMELENFNDFSWDIVLKSLQE